MCHDNIIFGLEIANGENQNISHHIPRGHFGRCAVHSAFENNFIFCDSKPDVSGDAGFHL